MAEPKAAKLKKSRFSSVFELISVLLPILLTVFQSRSSKDVVVFELQSTGAQGGVNVTIDDSQLRNR